VKSMMKANHEADVTVALHAAAYKRIGSYWNHYYFCRRLKSLVCAQPKKMALRIQMCDTKVRYLIYVVGTFFKCLLRT
jgi:hypothetical protein